MAGKPEEQPEINQFYHGLLEEHGLLVLLGVRGSTCSIPKMKKVAILIRECCRKPYFANYVFWFYGLILSIEYFFQWIFPNFAAPSGQKC